MMLSKRITSHDLQGNFLSTIEENLQEEDLDVHVDVTLRSEGEFEEVNEK